MKILIDGRLLSEGTGGIVSYFTPYLSQLIKEFSEEEFIICGTREISLFNFPNVRFLENSGPTFKIKKLKRFYDAFISFPRLLSKEKGDLLISPYYDFLVPIDYRGRAVQTLHDLCFWDLPNNYNMLSKVFHKLLFFLNKSRLYKLVTVSDFSRRRIYEHLNVLSTEAFYNSYDMPLFNVGEQQLKELKLKHGINEKQKYILYTSGLDSRKNINRLIECFSLCLKRNEDYRLILTGKESHYDEYMPLILEHNLEDKIVFTGFISDEELSLLYRIAHVVVNLSLYEGFGRANLEAMAYGVPLICSDIEIFKEIASDYANFVNPHKNDEIVETMLSVLEKEKSRHEKKIDSRFSFESNYKKWKNLVTAYKNERGL